MRPLYGGIGSILALHRVCERADRPRIDQNRHLEITPENLGATLEYLKSRGYDFVSMDEVAEHVSRRRGGRRFIAVTLDDGYADVMSLALPVFQRLAVPFTLYVATSFPDRTAVLWWYELEDQFLACADAPGCASVFEQQAHALAEASPQQYRERLAATLTSGGDQWRARIASMALTWDEVAALSRDPLATIGAHSVDHLALSRMSESEARAQMLDSKRRLEACTGKPVRHFAYPYGSRWAAGSREFALARECGFATAVTTRSGNIFRAHRDAPTSLPRIELSDPTVADGVDRIGLWLDGCVPCYENRFRRIVTL